MKTLLEKAARRVKSWREKPQIFFYEELKMTPEAWLDEYLEKLPSQDPKEKQIALKACTGAGKSAALAGTNLWFVTCFGGTDPTQHPVGAVTSIDEDNLRSGLWKEIAVWRGRSELLQQTFGLTATRLSSYEHPQTWYIEARTWAKRADREAQGRAMSGLHGKFILLTLDETGDMPVPLLRVSQQIFSSAHAWAKIVAGGNPTSLIGVLYHMCVLEAHRTLLISITADPDDPKRGQRTDIENAKEQIRLYGRDNPWVMATILGQFPPSSINALLGIEDVEKAMKRAPTKDQWQWAQKRLGVDCARFGDDRTTLCPRQGLMWFKPTALRGVRTNVISGRIVQAVNKWNPRNPQDVWIGIDQTGGWGQGTVDQLLVAGLEPQELVYSTPAPDPKYYNLRSYMWFEMAKHIRRSAALPPHVAELRPELTAPTYSLKEGKLILEPKEMIKARLGYSPDVADGYAQTYAIPDMPADFAKRRQQGRQAATEFDPFNPNRDEEQRKSAVDFNPFEESVI